jgi:putative ABC transport system substrate-binding protein
MNRRRFLLTSLAGVLAVPRAAGAQKEGKVARVGFLVMARNPGVESAFPRGLAELGYLEGRDVTIEWRSADGRVDQLEVLASELVRLAVDVIVAAGPEARIAAMKATTTIPIVVVGGSDAVAEGWAASLARPGGNVTGLTVTYPEILSKQLELLTEMVSGLARVAVIRDPDAIPPQVSLAQTKAIQAAARSLRVSIDYIEVRRPTDLDSAFSRAAQDRRRGVIVNETAMIFAHRADIAKLAHRSRLPSIGQWRPSADAGYLATYGADLSDLLRGSARHVHRILKGVKPAELPIEQPTRFQFVINLKTAKALGLTIPPSLLARADQVIE